MRNKLPLTQTFLMTFEVLNEEGIVESSDTLRKR